MSAFLILIVRFTVLYFLIRLIWSLLSGRKNTIPHGKKKAQPRMKRYDTHGKNISDGDYEEVQ